MKPVINIMPMNIFNFNFKNALRCIYKAKSNNIYKKKKIQKNKMGPFNEIHFVPLLFFPFMFVFPLYLYDFKFSGQNSQILSSDTLKYINIIVVKKLLKI